MFMFGIIYDVIMVYVELFPNHVSTFVMVTHDFLHVSVPITLKLRHAR